MRRRNRLLLEAIERRPRDAPVLQRLVKRALVHYAAARGVEQICVRLHQGEFARLDETARLFRKRTVNGNKVGLTEQLFQSDKAHAELGSRFFIDKWVEG